MILSNCNIYNRGKHRYSSLQKIIIILFYKVIKFYLIRPEIKSSLSSLALFVEKSETPNNVHINKSH